MTRRDLIVLSAAAATAQGAPFAFFTEAEASLVVMICEQIIPKDEFPGATDAGVVQYIDRELMGPLKPFAQLYRDQLPAFEPMRTMSFAEQTEFLKRMEKTSRLFGVMIDHTMQGFYGRDAGSWKMLGIEHELGGHH